MDDSASPHLEGNETFIVFLSSAMSSGLGTPSEAIVVINDTADDGMYLESVSHVESLSCRNN